MTLRSLAISDEDILGNSRVRLNQILSHERILVRDWYWCIFNVRSGRNRLRRAWESSHLSFQMSTFGMCSHLSMVAPAYPLTQTKQAIQLLPRPLLIAFLPSVIPLQIHTNCWFLLGMRWGQLVQFKAAKSLTCFHFRLWDSMRLTIVGVRKQKQRPSLIIVQPFLHVRSLQTEYMLSVVDWILLSKSTSVLYTFHSSISLICSQIGSVNWKGNQSRHARRQYFFHDLC